MLPDGDTQISADDMNRLSESPGLLATGVSPLQLIYATLSTISEQGEVARVGEGRSALLTAELIGGIHTTVLSSMQDGVTVHSVTYHLPKIPGASRGEDSGGKLRAGALINKGDDGLLEMVKAENITTDGAKEVSDGVHKVELPESSVGQVLLQDSGVAGDDEGKPDGIFFSGDSEGRPENPIIVSGDTAVTVDSPMKFDILNRSEKMLGPSVLREMLESREKVSVLNAQEGMVNFITVDFLDPSVVNAASTNIGLDVAH